MPIEIDKKALLALFCVLRQAERSVHYAHSSAGSWNEFIDYYDDSKMANVAESIRLLKAAGAASIDLEIRRSPSEGVFMGILFGAARRLVNPYKSDWSFTAEEVSFFAATLERLTAVLASRVQPRNDDLVALRMHCHECHAVISRKLIGVPELERALWIEHFRQADHVKAVTFRDMGVIQLGRAAGDGLSVGRAS